jgi:DNA-binding XRE family transcriptional regulator
MVYLWYIMTARELRRARKQLSMNQTGLAEAIGMQKNSIARMERGERPILKHTELSVKYLLLTGGGETMKKKSGKRPLDQAIERHDRAVRANVSRGPEGRRLAAVRAAKTKRGKHGNR